MGMRTVGAWIFMVVAIATLAGCARSEATRHQPPQPAAKQSQTIATSNVEEDFSGVSESPDDVVIGWPHGQAVSGDDPRRNAILDSLRPKVEEDVSQHVRFKVHSIRAAGHWAAVSATPQGVDGSRIDYSRTRYAKPVELGMFDDGLLALLEYSDGRWHLVEYGLGMTDYPGTAWLYEHQVGANLFWQ